MRKKIYLAGAIGCYKENPDKATKWRSVVRGEITEKTLYSNKEDWDVFNPTYYYNYWNPSHRTEKEIIRFEFNQLRQSDVVLVNLKDLEKSLGTSDEILFSYLHGIPVIGFYEDSDDISFVHPWKIEQIDRIETGKDALQNAIEYILEYYS